MIRILIRYLLTVATPVAIAGFAVMAIADQTPSGGSAEAPIECAIDDPPGVDPLPEPLRRERALAVARLGGDYVPRAEQRRDNGQPRYTSHLALSHRRIGESLREEESSGETNNIIIMQSLRLV